MDIIKELEDLKSYVAGLARTDMEFCTMPPQHGFSSSATIEQVLSKIDVIENKAEQELNKNNSVNCTALNAFIKAYVSAGGPCTQKFIDGLHHYVNAINGEIAILKSTSIYSNILQRFLNKIKVDKL